MIGAYSITQSELQKTAVTPRDRIEVKFEIRLYGVSLKIDLSRKKYALGARLLK